ncbi:unnamed protein product, partial [Pleuronectes platessa]
DVKALQPEGQLRAGAPHHHPEALHHLRVSAGISGLADQQHWQDRHFLQQQLGLLHIPRLQSENQHSSPQPFASREYVGQQKESSSLYSSDQKAQATDCCIQRSPDKPSCTHQFHREQGGSHST